MSSPGTPDPESESGAKQPPVRKATVGMAMMAILILFFVGVAIGFVLGRTV